jgi:Putative transposase/Transposase zinc-binding domain
MSDVVAPAEGVEPPRPLLEVADIVRLYGPAFLARQGASLSATQRRALADVAACRTAALGGHVQRCGSCGQEAIAYNSCRNRHCPKCQGSRTSAWLRREVSLLLPADYYHVVFTLPPSVASVVWQNQRQGYGLLFRAVQETLREVAANPRHLGAQVGLLLVLHTWGQDLHYHPHLHVVATGGGLACEADGVPIEPARWVSCRPGFFLPVRVLSRVFRGKYLALLQQAHAAGKLRFYGEQSELSQAERFAQWRRQQYGTDWVVYAKAPFGGPEQVLKYLARYTHRVALTNHRLLSCDGGVVRFTAKDYAAEGRRKVVALSAEEFLRRWLQHVLPCGFVKIRHAGLLSNRKRTERLALCHLLLALAGMVLPVVKCLAAAEARGSARGCPHCGADQWLLVGAVLPAGESVLEAKGSAPVSDTS